MNFKELLSQLEERLGSHQFPVNAAATTIKNIFEGSPLHHDTMTNLARAIYVSNACRRLTDPVHLEQTLKALAPIRQQALRSPKTDVDLYRLLNDLDAALNEIFADTRTPIKIATPTRHTAEVIQLSAYRLQRQLKTSA
jgi:hypothetical protein